MLAQFFEGTGMVGGVISPSGAQIDQKITKNTKIGRAPFPRLVGERSSLIFLGFVCISAMSARPLIRGRPKKRHVAKTTVIAVVFESNPCFPLTGARFSMCVGPPLCGAQS